MALLKSPKDFSLRVISPKKASEYNELWHSRLPKLHYTNIIRNRYFKCYGAFFQDQCYAVGIWSSPVARKLDSNTILELRRLAISSDCPKFTATWMLGKMIKDIRTSFPTIKKLISYQDRIVHTGTIYKAGNWKIDGYTKAMKSWGTCRERDKQQTISKKIRWRYDLE